MGGGGTLVDNPPVGASHDVSVDEHTKAISPADSPAPVTIKDGCDTEHAESMEREIDRRQAGACAAQGKIWGMSRRWVLVALACIGIAISYADRTNIAIAIIPMSKEFGWNPVLEGIIFSSFFYGYMATQILGGYLSDRFGGKWVLAAGALGWSVFTLLTPLAAHTSFAFLIVCRVVLGISEGVAYPAINSLLSAWLPRTERSRATGAVNSFSYAGAALALVLSSPICASDQLGWPFVFYLFGTLGLLWLVPWVFMVSPRPAAVMPPDYTLTEISKEDDGEVKVAERRPVPWARILSNKYTWAIIVNQYCNCWGFFVLLQWVPSFYTQEFGVDLKSLGLVSILPYIVQFTVGLIVGFVADWLVNVKRVPLVYIRKGSQTIALLGSAVFLLLAGFVATNIVQGITFITCALGINSLSNVGLSVAHFDINTEYAGIIFGLGNTAATLTGIIGVQVTGLVLAWTGSWSLVFLLAAFHYVLGVIVWLLFAHPDRKLILDE